MLASSWLGSHRTQDSFTPKYDHPPSKKLCLFKVRQSGEWIPESQRQDTLRPKKGAFGGVCKECLLAVSSQGHLSHMHAVEHDSNSKPPHW